MAAIELAPYGILVNTVSPGLIDTVEEAEVFAAVLIYRFVAFWLPIPPGVIAFFQLRNTVKEWKAEGLPIDRPPRPSLLQPDV